MRNLFDKKTYNIEADEPEKVNTMSPMPQRKPLFEFEGRMEEYELSSNKKKKSILKTYDDQNIN